MTFSGNFMPPRFGAGKPQKPKVKTYRGKVSVLKAYPDIVLQDAQGQKMTVKRSKK